jgi:hypothetical protein
MAHQVLGATIRAHIVQSEAARKWERDEWLPYIWRAIDNIPAGHPATADYWLTQLEKFVGAISQTDLNERVAALQPAITEEGGLQD